MPSLDHDADSGVGHTSHERHKRSKARDKDNDRDRHRSSKSSSRSKVGIEGSEASTRKHRKRDKYKNKDLEQGGGNMEYKEKISSLSDPAANSRTSLDTQRISLPYPSFSKAHSKEAVMSREKLEAQRQPASLTPEPTDAGDEDKMSKSAEMPRKSSTTSKKGSRPPSPPETDISSDRRRLSGEVRDHEGHRSKSAASNIFTSAFRTDDRSKLSRRSGSSSQATFVKAREHKSHEKLRHFSSVRSSSSRHSIKRSESTRSNSKRAEAQQGDSSSSSARDPSPRTPTQSATFPPHFCEGATDKLCPEIAAPRPGLPQNTATPASLADTSPFHGPHPQPPPPPAIDVHETPRVDYLLQNGGLPCPVPKRFLSVLPAQNGATCAPSSISPSAETLFSPFLTLLDQYSTVLAKQGSIAVATGHRSVARRLLDRVENVFSRDLPSHGCICIMCEESRQIHKGLTWGDVLEWVSGRIDLPPWPPFDLAEIGMKAAEVSADIPPRPSSPVKMDPDIAEEFREYYLRQSKKVRSAVDRWLSNTGETPAPALQDVDDETLSFAIMTNMDAKDRPFFTALLSGTRDLAAATRAPTPTPRPRNDFMIRSGLSLQRLYRLQQVPRDPESATYLVKNPHTHDLLVTISSINTSEWEILTSGRFDGFLWSGADADDAISGFEPRGETPFGHRSSLSPPPRGTSAASLRNPTPLSPYSRGATPASFVSLASSGIPGANKQPVSNDEETEAAAIAEIEREIYAGMEILEDAFEKLHQKAETVRTALRQRGAGLMQNLQSRRRIDVLPTPGSGNSQQSGYERPTWATGSDGEGASDEEWGLDNLDIMPDDSASNISSSRHRRPKRRTERRTPAPIEEDDEE
ncbi:hypothetical protein AAL_02245 [Moelleriella libera RCEF 2490]|uniref:5-Methylcytosine G/T mismatch-specific DNA glycosylase n=1 Tax=Moelleriella libera RCEF 2490 TaxID=1081109 RepID=A0A168FB10_9HYPO|nr:hypothetical protein AAL_02245 [Moelleriella libera RCEF 2490]